MSNNTLKNYLDGYLNNVSDDCVKLFEAITTLKKFSKGDVVVQYDRPTTKFYIIKEGLVGSFLTNNKGKEFIRSLYFKDKAFGALSSFIKAGINSNASYNCLTDCELYEANCEDFIKLKNISPVFEIIYNKVLEDVNDRYEKKIDSLSLLDGTERYLNLTREVPNINNLLPQYQIAYYLSVTPVQLSRIRKKIFSKQKT